MKNIGRYLMALVGVGMAFACGGGGSSGLQQTCSNSGDCESGLLCMAGVCVQNDYPVDTTSKDCIVVECSDDVDCCAAFEPNFFCQQAIDACNAGVAGAGNGGIGDPCEEANSPACTCNQVCTEQQCVDKEDPCTTDDNCPSAAAPLCDVGTGTCVECLADTDCTEEGDLCVSNTCKPPCTTNEECPLFWSCDTTAGECKESGCADNRDCIMWTGRADSVCKEIEGQTTKECSLPCKENVECGSLGVCTNGECAFLGCDTDEQCRIFLDMDNLTPVQGQPIPKALCVELEPGQTPARPGGFGF